MTTSTEHLAYLQHIENALQTDLDQYSFTGPERGTDEISFFFNHIMPSFTSLSACYFNLDSPEFEKVFVMDSDKDYRKRINTPYYAKGHGARRCKNPFPKDLTIGPAELYNRWCGAPGKSAVQQHWPDFGLTIEGKINVVFEAKYFKGKGSGNPGSTLAKALYEAAFYLGLPSVKSDNPRQTWSAYDYACLIAVDSSPDHALLNAYVQLPDKVKESFWVSSSIFPMILTI